MIKKFKTDQPGSILTLGGGRIGNSVHFSKNL